MDDELVSRYEALCGGDITRAQAASWARSHDYRSVSFSSADPGLWRDALYTLGASATKSVDVFDVHSAGPESPYFIRESDLNEWLANLRRTPLAATPLGHTGRFRLWDAPPYVREDVATVRGVFDSELPCESLRGVDGLDYFEHLALVLPSGRRALVQHHGGSPPDGTTVHLEFVDGHAENALTELLLCLGLNESDVTWRSDRYFDGSAGAI